MLLLLNAFLVGFQLLFLRHATVITEIYFIIPLSILNNLFLDLEVLFSLTTITFHTVLRESVF